MYGTVTLTLSEHEGLKSRISELESLVKQLKEELQYEHEHNRSLAAENVRLRRKVKDAE